MHFDCLRDHSQHPNRVLGIDYVGLGHFKVVQGACPVSCALHFVLGLVRAGKRGEYLVLRTEYWIRSEVGQVR